MADDPLTSGYLAGQGMAARRAVGRLNGALAGANANLAYAQQVIWDYEAMILDLRAQTEADQAELERLKLELHAEKASGNKLAEEVKRLTEVAAEIPRLASALRAQRDVSRNLQEQLQKYIAIT